MKKICLLFLFSIVFSPLFAQRQSFTWQDVQREYIINVPSSWDGQREIPVLFVLHGLNAEIEETSSQLNATMFSDLTGWITIFPQALDANINVMGQDISLGKMWNANLSVNIMGMTIAPNSEIDDQGFILSILDSVKEQYAIDEDSIFVAGGSMGGFMANYMGIKHSDIFKGMAAISGSVPNILVDSIPSNHINVLYIHGTNDEVVNYYDGSTNMLSIISGISIGLGAEQTVDYWKNTNACNSLVEIDSLEDRKEDGLRFIAHKYSNLSDYTKVHFIKVEGGEHAWYTDANIYDIDYSTEIYNFFSNNNIPYISLLSTEKLPQYSFAFYPNPAKNNINIYSNEDCFVQISNSLGQIIKKYNISYGYTLLDISCLDRGIYFVSFFGNKSKITKQLVVE